MDNSQDERPQALSVDELRDVIRRAAELDLAGQELLAVEEVRAIAAELGISERAFTQAITEFRREQSGASRSHILRVYADRVVRSSLSGLVIGGTAAVATFMGLSTWPASFEPIWVLIAVPTLLALTAGGENRQLTFQLRNVGFWVGIFASMMLILGEPLDSLGWPAAFTGMAATVGGFLVWATGKLTGRYSSPGGPDSQPTQAVLSEISKLSTKSSEDLTAERRVVPGHWRFDPTRFRVAT